MMLAPVVLFVYNRPDHTIKTLEALMKNDLASQSELFIYCDGPKPNADSKTKETINKVRSVIREQKWCKNVTIYESETNKGLAESIVSGVTKIINKYGKIIVLEDDIVTSVAFLRYMNKGLNLYENESKVMHIGSYLPTTKNNISLPETFFSRFMSCWGWGTWKTSWDMANWDAQYLYNQIKDPKALYEFNLEGVLDFHTQLEENINGSIKTWAIKWFASVFLNEGLCLYPKVSLSSNIGLDGSGENCDDQNVVDDFNFEQNIQICLIPLKESNLGKLYLQYFYIYGRDSSFSRRLKSNYVKSRYQLILSLKNMLK